MRRCSVPRLGLPVFCLSIALGVAGSPRTASANGRFPAAQLVQLSPDGQSVALRVTFGFVLSDDGGRSFRWLCEDVLGYGTGAFDPAFVFDADRRLFVGAPDGLARVSSDRCAPARVGELDRQFVIDLDRSGDGATVLAITSSGAADAVNRVWRSTDRGATFQPMGAGVGPDTLFETVELARSNPLRVYATAVRNSPRRVVFFRSDDGGATLSERSLDAFELDDAFVAAIDPRDADTVYLRGRLRGAPPPDAGPGAAPTALLVSRDGGATFRELTRSVGPMTGFAISDDGASLWTGSTHPDDGLRLSTDRGARWERVSDTHVTGLRFDRGTLWVAANWVLDGFALGRSDDGGRTIAPALRTFCDVLGAPVCPPSTDVSALCAARWTIFRTSNLGCTQPPPVEPPASDASLDVRFDASAVRDDAAAPSPGCRCAVPARPSRDGGAPLALCAAVALALSARRAAGPARPGPTRSRTR